MLLSLSFNEIFKDSFLSSFKSNISMPTICMTLIFSFLISLYVFFIYKLTTKNVIYSRKFNVTIALMSIITSAIVLSMQANITVSLGMVGALSIVRFRTSIKDPRDLLFLFWSISNGIIIGSQIYSISFVLAIVVGISLLLFDIIPEKKTPFLLVIYFNDVKEDEFNNILNFYKIKYRLKSSNISSNESSYIYELKLKDNKDFINEIKNIKGVKEVSLLSQDGECSY